MRNNSKRRKLNRDAGFSLLELLIAVVILSIIVIPLLNVFLTSNRLNIKSRQTLRATTAAQDIMEGLKAYNIEELKAQFADPASGFYVIDSRLVKGEMKEEDALEKDPSGNPIKGLYVFSMRELNLQGSKFDAKIEVDGRGYMAGSTSHTQRFNDSPLSNARSIAKVDGTFVETSKIREAVLLGTFEHPDIKAVMRAKLKASGVPDDKLDEMLLARKTNASFKNFKEISANFDNVAREIKVELEKAIGDIDENGHHRVFMKVTQKYIFDKGLPTEVSITGYAGSPGGIVENKPCGKITATKDGSLNVNLFYYPLYDPSGKTEPDKIIIENKSGADLNLLIAKQRVDIGDLEEYLTDLQLMQAEDGYHAEVEINGAGGPMDDDHFTLKTNLGMHLVGKDFLKSQGRTSEYAEYVNNQVKVNTLPLAPVTPPAVGSTYHIFTLGGMRSPMGQPASADEASELIYDVEVAIYAEGAADDGFPEEKRMVVIGGSMTN